MKPENTEFEPIRRLLARPVAAPRLPDFNPAWLNQKPVQSLTVKAESEILDRAPRPAVWLAAAAAVLLSVGGLYIGYRTYFAAPAPEADVARAIVLHSSSFTAVLSEAEVQRLRQAGATPAEWGQAGRALKPGVAVSRGEWIWTGAAGAADLALSSGVVVRVTENSLLQLTELVKSTQRNRAERLYLERGRALSMVERLAPGDTYEVRTPTAIAGVRGTSFRVSTDGASSEVYVVRGLVSVRGLSNESGARDVEQNQLARIADAGAVPEVLPNQDEEFRDERDLDELARGVEGAGADRLEEMGVDERLLEARADRRRSYNRIVMKDGSMVRGEIVSQSGRRVFIETEERSFIVDANEVHEVLFGDQ